MAAKESQHREMVESLNGQLTQVKRQHDELTALSRDQVLFIWPMFNTSHLFIRP